MVKDRLTDTAGCNGEIGPEALAGHAGIIPSSWEMGQGKRSAHYTERATCHGCGPMWLWSAGEVLGCP